LYDAVGSRHCTKKKSDFILRCSCKVYIFYYGRNINCVTQTGIDIFPGLGNNFWLRAKTQCSCSALWGFFPCYHIGGTLKGMGIAVSGLNKLKEKRVASDS